MSVLKTNQTLLHLQLQSTFAYRGMMVIWMVHTFFTPFTMFLVWNKLGSTNASIATVMPQITYFYLLLPFATNLAGAWQSSFLANTIRTGGLNPFLIKPFSHLWYDVTNNLSEKVLKTIILLPLIVLGFLIFQPPQIVSFTTASLFLVSLTFGAMLNFLIEQAMGYSAFWLDDISGMRNFKEIGYFTFGGAILPFFLFPPALQLFAAALPFRYLGAFSVEIVSNSLSLSQIFQGLLIQLVYILLSVGITLVLWRNGIRRYSAFGG